MKRSILLLLAALVLMPDASFAVNGCGIIEYPDHVEVNCAGTSVPKSLSLPVMGASPLGAVLKQSANNAPVQPRASEAETPKIDLIALKETISGKQRRPGRAALEGAKQLRNEIISSSRQ